MHNIIAKVYESAVKKIKPDKVFGGSIVGVTGPGRPLYGNEA